MMQPPEEKAASGVPCRKARNARTATSGDAGSGNDFTPPRNRPRPLLLVGAVAEQMLDVPVVLGADVLEQILTEDQARRAVIHRPWTGICFGIIDGERDLEC